MSHSNHPPTHTNLPLTPTSHSYQCPTHTNHLFTPTSHSYQPPTHTNLPLITTTHSYQPPTHTNLPLIPTTHSHQPSTHNNHPLRPTTHSHQPPTHTNHPLTPTSHSHQPPTHTNLPLIPTSHSNQPSTHNNHPLTPTSHPITPTSPHINLPLIPTSHSHQPPIYCHEVGQELSFRWFWGLLVFKHSLLFYPLYTRFHQLFWIVSKVKIDDFPCGFSVCSVNKFINWLRLQYLCWAAKCCRMSIRKLWVIAWTHHPNPAYAPLATCWATNSFQTPPINHFQGSSWTSFRLHQRPV